MPSKNPKESATYRTVGRKKKWAENMTARFPEGTLKRMDDVLTGKDARTDLIARAVERELQRLEKKQAGRK